MRRLETSFHSLVHYFLKAEPGHVPASVALWVIANPCLSVLYDTSTEGVVPRKTPQFCEELVAVDIIFPCFCHGPLESNSIILIVTDSRYPLEADELSERVDTM